MKFSEKMQDIINKGIVASRDFVSKASEQAQVWGEMGVLKIEIVQLRSQAEKTTAQLGALVYAALSERGEPSVSVGDPAVVDLLARIKALETEIDAKEDRYRRLGGKDSDLEQGHQG